MIVYLLNILLVDDDKDTLRIVQKYFEKKGAHVSAYSNPLLALQNFMENSNADNDNNYDLERFGVLEAFGSLRQCDLVIVLGTVNRKMAPRLRLVYDQMPNPKYVIAMGACSITGGLYFDSYNVLPGVDGVIPVDVYVPGCPPRPETLIQGIMLLQEKIKRQGLR